MGKGSVHSFTGLGHARRTFYEGKVLDVCERDIAPDQTIYDVMRKDGTVHTPALTLEAALELADHWNPVRVGV